MAAPQQSASITPTSFADLPLELREQIYGLAMDLSKSSRTISFNKPSTIIRSLAHTSRFVRREAMILYYSQKVFWHTVAYFPENESDNNIYIDSNLQKWLDNWGALAMPHIRSLEIDIFECHGGVSYGHKMHIDLTNVETPVSTDVACWGAGRSPRGSWNLDTHLEDINALVRALLVKLPGGERIFTPQRFKAMMKGLWHSHDCVGGSNAPHTISMISSKSMAHGFASKSAEGKEQMVSALLGTGA